MEQDQPHRNYYLRYLSEGGEASNQPYFAWLYNYCQLRDEGKIRAALLQAVDHVIGDKECGEGGVFCPNFEDGTSCASAHRQYIISINFGDCLDVQKTLKNAILLRTVRHQAYNNTTTAIQGMEGNG